jgi:ATP-dependent protease ClpP protease subunit
MKNFIILVVISLFFSLPVTANTASDATSEYIDRFVMRNQYQITVARDSSGITYIRHEGMVGHLFSYMFITHLQRYPDIQYIEMNSPGGLMTEVFAVGQYIRDHSLPVRIRYGENCVSACAFISLYSPSITIDGQMSFHRPYDLGYPTDMSLYEINQLSVERTLRIVHELFDNRWNMFLYILIDQHTDDEMLLTFRSSRELEMFRLEDPADFTETINHINNLYHIVSPDELMEYSETQINNELIVGIDYTFPR